MTVPLCFIDTETTGIHPARQIWEIAVIRREAAQPAVLDCTHQSFVEVDLSEADPYGLTVGKFYDRHPRGKQLAGSSAGDRSTRSRRDVALAVAQWTHGAHLVGVNPAFDAEKLAELLREHGLTPAWHYHLIDVSVLALGWLSYKAQQNVQAFPDQKWKPWPELPWKSDDLSRAVGVDPPEGDARHTALGDADWARRIYDAITTTPQERDDV